MYPLIAALTVNLYPNAQDLDLTLDFNSDDTAFNEDLEYVDDEEEIII
ncbi:17359_t:CDS:1, partial [Racocetra fulgida]